MPIGPSDVDGYIEELEWRVATLEEMIESSIIRSYNPTYAENDIAALKSEYESYCLSIEEETL